MICFEFNRYETEVNDKTDELRSVKHDQISLGDTLNQEFATRHALYENYNNYRKSIPRINYIINELREKANLIDNQI